MAIANAKASSSSANIQVDYVHHIVDIRNGGLVVINDTIRLSPLGNSSEILQSYSFGFPIDFQSNLVYCFAHDSSNEQLDVVQDVGLGQLGFYGITVSFPSEGVNLSPDRSYNFTVVFVFSNLISSKDELVPEEPVAGEPELKYRHETRFYVDFPMYPSLTQNTSMCNITITIPDYVYVSNSSRGEWIGAREVLNHVKRNLTAFAYEETGVLKTNVPLHEPPVTYEEEAQLKLGIEMDAPTNAFTVISVDEIERDITLTPWGQILLSDSYHITNEAGNLSLLRIQLPQDAYDASYRDEQGGHSIDSDELPTATVFFKPIVRKNESTKFLVTYELPWEKYVNYRDWRNFDFATAFFEQGDLHWITRKLSVTVNLPEGAKLQPSSLESLLKDIPEKGISLKNADIQGLSTTFLFNNVTPLHDLDFRLTCEYLIFWASFYPTLWMGLLVTAVGVLAFLWRAPKPPLVPVAPVSPKALRSFADTYEQKIGAGRELEMLEQQVRKRKISMRRYKVRKKALEGRLSVLSKDLTNLKEEMSKASSRYANTMRQIEIAETELEETEAAIRRIQLRYRRREISKETYHKLLGEYNRRKEKAQTTIDGVLLRLREEIR
jgi:hypothetical protein